MNISSLAGCLGEGRGEKAIPAFSETEGRGGEGRRVGRVARSLKARSNNPPTLISAVSFCIHHVSVICFYGNRLGSQPNAFRPLCF